MLLQKHIDIHSPVDQAYARLCADMMPDATQRRYNWRGYDDSAFLAMMNDRLSGKYDRPDYCTGVLADRLSGLTHRLKSATEVGIASAMIWAYRDYTTRRHRIGYIGCFSRSCYFAAVTCSNRRYLQGSTASWCYGRVVMPAQNLNTTLLSKLSGLDIT